MIKFLGVLVLFPVVVSAQFLTTVPDFEILRSKIDIVMLYREMAKDRCRSTAEYQNNPQIIDICLCSAEITADTINKDPELIKFLTWVYDDSLRPSDEAIYNELENKFNKTLVEAGRKCVPAQMRLR